MKLLLTVIITLSFLTISRSQADSSTNSGYPHLYEMVRQQWQTDQEVFARVDTLIPLLLESEYTLCHFHSRYRERHDYESMHNPYLDELSILSFLSRTYEKYIFDKVIGTRVAMKSDAAKWKNCLILIPKNDCSSSHRSRLDRIPSILQDTSSLEAASEIVYRVANVLSEPCASTLNKLQYDVAWRKKIFESITLQVRAFYQQNEDYDFELHMLMRYLPDSLTTRFAYDYVMNINNHSQELPHGIIEILEHRFKDWGPDFGLTRYLGPRVLMSDEDVRTLIERATEVQETTECVWCPYIIGRLGQRFDE